MAKTKKAYKIPPAPPPEEAAEIVRELLRITNIGQTALGDIAGVSQGTISKWANEEHDPCKSGWDQLMAFAASDPDTAHLAHRYVIGLFRGNREQLADLSHAIVLGEQDENQK